MLLLCFLFGEADSQSLQDFDFLVCTDVEQIFFTALDVEWFFHWLGDDLIWTPPARNSDMESKNGPRRADSEIWKSSFKIQVSSI